MPLTDTLIRSLKPVATQFKRSDARGLHLLVTPQGSKLWRLAYRYAGKQRTLALGIYPDVPLADARKARDAAKALLAKGIDPADEKRREKAARAVRHASTFEAVATDLIRKRKLEGNAQVSLDKNYWAFRALNAKLGKRPIAEIEAPEILLVLRKAEADGRLEKASRMRMFCSAVFRHAIATSRAKADPTAGLRGALSRGKVKHRPAITDPAAFGALLRAIDGYTGQPVTAAALKLLPLVFTRPSELRLARWAEFNMGEAIWTIPAERTKMRREHKVPLAKQTIAILEDLRRVTGDGELVFPGFGQHGKPLSENTFNAALRRLGIGKDEMVSHGFRASASTLLNESRKFSPDAVERALAHQDSDSVRRAYARGEFWAERVQMAQWWADYLDTLKTGAQVIPFRDARSG